jgi:hypothetical protein
MRFGWDEEKNQANSSKHGVTFEEAMKAFADPDRKIRFNSRHSAEELRCFCLGKVGNRIMTVRFTLRGTTIRIIGAGYWREGKKIYGHD